MTAPVFLAEPAELAGATAGGTLTLIGEEARHAATVRRLRPGEDIELVDGAGLRVRGSVLEAGKDRLDVAVAAVARDELPRPSLVLLQALAKGGRDEQAVESATELGVDALVPWQAERSVAQWRGPEKAARGRRRWEAVARAAAKQSRRSRVPEVRGLATSTGLPALVREAVGAGGAALVLHESAEAPVTRARLPEPGSAAEILVVVGPEGGLTDAEVETLADAGGQVLLAGPHVLRSSTAGPAALAVLAARLRWG